MEVKQDKNEIGIIFHWGLYSVTAFDDIKSLRRRKMKNGAEWYYKRLTETSEYRPISGHKETKKYHEQEFRGRDYYSLKTDFDDVVRAFDFAALFAELVNKNIGYIILTAKHHDGFCLWDTATTSNKSSRDLIGEFVKTARDFGIKVGIYYSWFEFGKNMTKKFISDVVIPQMIELEKYKPDYWWFDGDWAAKSNYAKETIADIVDKLRRTAKANSRVTECGDFDVKIFGDREMPTKMPDFAWEYIFTIGHSWGYNREQEGGDYMNGGEIYSLYKKVSAFGGNFLINFGLKANGGIDERELAAYNEFIGML